MKYAAPWALGLALLSIILLQPPCAWGKVRTHSGALTRQSGIEHPKELERRIFQLTNEARRKNGLSALEPDDMLTTMAREKSDDMAKRHYFSHTSPEGKTIIDHYDDEKPAKIGLLGKIGENIHMGQRNDYSDIKTSARVIVDSWMISPGHRKNILDPAYTHLGVGVAVKGKECYATQSFGQKVGQKFIRRP
jgi:uncharacterized protein YkwD